MNGFNPRPSSFMGVLAWAATEARLKGFAFCPLAGERVGGCAVEWLSRSFDAMSPTHKFDVEVTDLAKGTHTTFAVIRKQRTYRKTGKTTVRYNTPVGNFSTFDEVNAALVAEALAAAGAEGEREVVEVDSEGSEFGVHESSVLSAPERHEQPQQRHYAGAVAEASEEVCPVCGEALAPEDLGACPCMADDPNNTSEMAPDEYAEYQRQRHQPEQQHYAQAMAAGAAAAYPAWLAPNQLRHLELLGSPELPAPGVELVITAPAHRYHPGQVWRLTTNAWGDITSYAMRPSQFGGEAHCGYACWRAPEDGPTAQVEQQQAQQAVEFLPGLESGRWTETTCGNEVLCAADEGTVALGVGEDGLTSLTPGEARRLATWLVQCAARAEQS